MPSSARSLIRSSRRLFPSPVRWTVLLLLVVSAGWFGARRVDGESQQATAGRSADAVWQILAGRPDGVAARENIGGQHAVVRFSKAEFDARLAVAGRDTDPASSGVVLTMPMPDGSFERFLVRESPMLDPALASAFPEFKTYSAQGLDDPAATARIGWTAAGFHAIVLTADRGSVYIDPYAPATLDTYVSYRKSDLQKGEAWQCLVAGEHNEAFHRAENSFPISHGGTLRTYRLALAATSEYTTAAGGTKELALARMTTTINRVNGIYERELAVRMTLKTGTEADPTALIFLASGPDDGYSNNDGFAMLAENQTKLDAVILTANYDIGHVFSTGGGGIAALQSPCNASSKAQGVTGSPAPTGDAFDVDYVAHEIGHQFGGNHTFNGSANSCSGTTRKADHAYEVGSGSTIQAYAGICGVENLQNNSNDYFHVESLDEMTAFLTDGGGATCGTATATSNTLPTVEAGTNFTIPARTPFVLTAVGSDGSTSPTDSMTYAWEQFDLGPVSSSVATASTDDGSRPLFRSYAPTTSPTRYFPSKTYILNSISNNNVPPTTYSCGGATCLTGETLPTTARTMTFQVTARDNRANGGGIATDSMTVTTKDTGAPFKVTSQTTNTSHAANTQITVTWDVAGTTANDINAANVSIRLSTDGGTTFNTVLSASTANDGSEAVTIPNSVAATTQARVMVSAVGNIFFDINDTNFTVTAGGGGGGATAPATPAAPTGIPGNGSVNVSWTAPDNGGAAITGYQLQQSTSATGTFTNVASCPTNNTATSCNVTGLVNGTTYFFKVAAINPQGQSAFSPASAGITPVAPCSYVLSPDSASVDRLLSNETVTVTAGTGCAWTATVATDSSSMLSISSGSSGTGNGTVAYQVAVNNTGSARVGTMTIAGQTFTVTQSADSFTVDVTVQVGSTPVPGAFVALLGSTRKFGAVSGATGVARFRGVTPGTFALRAHSGGRAVTSGSMTVSASTVTATLSMSSSSSSLTTLGAYGSQTGTIVADGQTGVFYLNTTAIPSLYRTTDHGGTWSPVTLSSDDPATGLDASSTAGSPATSGRGGEIAAIVGNKVWYSFDFGLTWASMTAPTGVGNPQMYWAHIADTASTVSQLFLTSTTTASVYVADMTAATPAMTAMASSYKTNAGDLVAVGNGDTAPVIAVFDVVSGATKFWAVDSTPASTDTAVSVASLSPTLSTHGSIVLSPADVTLFRIGGPATGIEIGTSPIVKAPNTVLLYAVTGAPASNARMATCTAASCTYPLSTTFKNTDDTTSTTSTFANPATGQVSLCSANFGAVGSIAPTGGFGSVGQCWLTVNGTSLDVRGVQGINNNTGMAYDAEYDGSTNLVIISGDGQHGAAKSARMTAGAEFPSAGQNRPYFPGFPTIASAGSGATSGGIAVQGITSAVIRQSLYQPASSTNMASVMSFSGGGRTIGSVDGGTTWFTLQDRGGSRMDWWTGATAGSQWMVMGTGGAGNWMYGTRLASAADFTTSTSMPSVLNGSAQAVGPTEFAMSTSVITSPGVYGVKGITGTDYVGLGSYDGAKLRIDLAPLTYSSPSVTLGTLIPLLEVAIPRPRFGADSVSAAATGQNAGSIRMAYCPSAGSASSVADALFVATAAIDANGTGTLRKITGIGAGAALATPSFTGIVSTSLTVPTGSNLRDIAVDCAAGTVWLARSNSGGGGGGAGASAGILKSTDGGTTITPIVLPGSGTTNTALQNIVALDFNKTTTTQIVAVSRAGDVLVSNDSAGTWTLVNDTSAAACIGMTTQCGRGFGGEEPGSFAMPPATGASRARGRDGMAADTVSQGVLGSGAGLFSVSFSTPSAPGTIALSASVLNYAGVNTDGTLSPITSAQPVTVTATGNNSITWTATANQPWVQVTGGSGAGSGTFTIGIINPGNVLAGVTSGTATVTVTASNASNSPLTVTVNLRLASSSALLAPFGVFDTPAHEATVQGSIAVTGWALDDVGIDRVEIWRDLIVNDPVPPFVQTGHPASGKVFIANGTFVEGTRPDVEGLYATTPFKNRAGWGYLLLTWGFPNSNGTFVLTALAWDKEGNSTVLGTKTITVTNSTATKPFGSIDVPAYGATFTGHQFTFGWALTPNAGCTMSGGQRYMTMNSAPPMFNVTYGSNRTDIAGAFPGFADSNGAGGAVALDSTQYANGTHAIGWLVYDSCNNGEGIGSRFFTILNGAADARTAARSAGGPADVVTGAGPTFARAGQALDAVSVSESATPLRLMRGIARETRPLDRRATVWLSQTGRIELHAPVVPDADGADGYEAYLAINGALQPLPLGSSFDATRGIFYWQPVAGFLGEYPIRIHRVRGGHVVEQWTTPVVVSPGVDDVLLHVEAAGCDGLRGCVISGWSLDPRAAQGSGIGAVHVWATPSGTTASPTFVGIAAQHVTRTDVAAAYGGQFDTAGFTLPVTGLAPGTWDVVVYAWSEVTGQWEAARTVTLTVR